MKAVFFKIFMVLLAMVFFGKVLNWIFTFSSETTQLINMAMFLLIGIAYIVMGYVWHGRWNKIIITACGVFVIAMNFVNKNTAIEILSIACLLTPMLIARFYKEKTGNRPMRES